MSKQRHRGQLFINNTNDGIKVTSFVTSDMCGARVVFIIFIVTDREADKYTDRQIDKYKDRKRNMHIK